VQLKDHCTWGLKELGVPQAGHVTSLSQAFLTCKIVGISQLSVTIIKYLRQLTYKRKKFAQLPVLEGPVHDPLTPLFCAYG
jgi:hypothetical protein